MPEPHTDDDLGRALAVAVRWRRTAAGVCATAVWPSLAAAETGAAASVWPLAVGAALGAAVVLAVAAIAWRRTVARGVARRLSDLEDALARHAKSEKNLRQAYRKLERRMGQRTRELELEVAERRHAEERLRDSIEQAERANRAKSRFLAAASHDLRQPLQALGLFLHVLGGRIQKAENKEIMERIDQSLEAMGGLLNALLDVSKLEAGMVVAEMAEVPVGALLEHIATEFREQAERKGLGFRVVPTGVAIDSDPTLTENMVRNLVSNAVRYTREGRVLVGCRRRGDRVRIEVHDTGPGIPADRLDDIFEEFVQLENPARDRSRGLGLGLAIVSRTARLLGHTVHVTSTPGKGSVFAIEAPVSDGTAAAVPATADTVPPADISGRLVVVIEDEPSVLDGLDMALRKWDCRVVAAPSAAAALAQFPADHPPPDVIVADYRLAAEDGGAEAIERIRHRWQTDIPGIIITGDTAVDRLRDARRRGYRLLHKPVEAERLRALLGAAVGGGPIQG